MSFFKFDEENASAAFELPAEGKYEVVIVNAEAGSTQKGEPKLTVDFEIRSDFMQAHQGTKIMYNTFTFSHEVSVRIANSLIKACGFPNGRTFTSPQEMASELINKTLIIGVKYEEYTKDGEKRKSAKAKSFEPSKITPVTPIGNIPVDEDDLPF